MPMIYMPDDRNPLQREPYRSFTDKFNALDKIDAAEIRFTVPETDTFYGSFLFQYQNAPPLITVRFVKTASERWFISLQSDTFIGDDEPLSHYTLFADDIERQSELFYIPNMQLSTEATVGSTFRVRLDAILEEDTDLLAGSYALFNQLVAIFTFEN